MTIGVHIVLSLAIAYLTVDASQLIKARTETDAIVGEADGGQARMDDHNGSSRNRRKESS